MRHKRAAWAILVSMAATAAGGFGVTAEAATLTQTQSQSQALYTSQEQDVQTDGGTTVTQNASGQMSTTQTETSKVDGNGSVPEDLNQTKAGSNQYEVMEGHGNFSESQQYKVVTGQYRSSDAHSAQLQNQAQASSTQSGTIQSSGQAEITQRIDTLIGSQQSQTLQHQQSSVLPPKSSYAPSDVLGYAIFDLEGNLLSDSYGFYPSADNNWSGHYDRFVPFQPKTVVVKAVNAYGVPVNNTTPVTVHLRSSNVNSMFLMPHSTEIVHTIQLPVGTAGAEVVYMNTGELPKFDILDVPAWPVNIQQFASSLQHTPVLFVGQSQQGTIAGTTTSQSEQAVWTDRQANSYNGGQSQGMTASADANESQSVLIDTGGATNQSQKFSMNRISSGNVWDVTATQNTTSSTTNLVQLAQEQVVAVDDLWQNLKVTVQQTYNIGEDSISLQQSIQVGVPMSGLRHFGRTVSVTIGGREYQYAIGIGNPVVFDESQSVDTSKDNSVTEKLDIHCGSAVYHVPMPE